MRDRPQDRTQYRPQRSPRREAITSELDEHSNRIKELLRADLIMLQEENAALKAKCKKVMELEEKVEMILKQNTQLLSENEKLSKLLHQKKVEFETAKDRYEAQINQKSTLASDYDYERKKLVSQIEHLESEIQEIEHIKSSQINEVKAQYQVELQSLKRQTMATQEVYEQEIRKLRESLDKRDYQLSDTLNRLKRLSSQSEYDVLRLKEEKEKLRNQLIYVDADRKKENEGLRLKLEHNYIEEIESIKKNHLASLEGFEEENIKLKELLDQKSADFEQVNSKLSKQRSSYEEALLLLRRDNQMLRLKVYEAEQLCEAQREQCKLKLNKIHEADIEELRANHQKYLECLQIQISKLEGNLRKKNQQIEQLVQEKTSVRHMFDSQSERFKEQIDSLQMRIKEMQARGVQVSCQNEQRLKEKDRQIDYLQKVQGDISLNAENEARSLRQIIEHQKQESQKEQIIAKEKEQQMQDSISELKNENTTLHETVLKQRADKSRNIEDLQYELEGIIAQLKTKCEGLTSKNGIIEKQLRALKDSIASKEKEVRSLLERIKASQDRQKKLERDNDDMRAKIIKKDQKTNQMLSEQKQRLQATFAYTLSNMKLDHESSLKLQANKYQDIIEKLKRKEKQIDDLLRAYKKMRDEMEVLTEQEANKKDMTLKFAGATADLIATKNLFDVYLKSRVLDLCGDVRGKQNDQK